MVAIAEQRIYEPARARPIKIRTLPASPPPIIERVHFLPSNTAALDSPTPAEEAAWQLLKTFISPIDCNVFWQFQDLNGEIIEGVRAMNVNTTMNALLNGESVSLAYLTKKKFIQHCRGVAKYYYRSKWNGFASTGYGSHNNAWKSLGIDARGFALDGRKITSKSVALLLLGFDVDAHNGEHDVQKTTDLILDLFPGAFHEPSTNGEGRHIYVKLYYNIHSGAGGHHATLQYIQNLCTTIADAIESRRKQLGFDAALDGIRGLPTMIGFEKEDGRPVMVKRSLPDGTIIERPKLKVTCRNPVIKIPFYKNCTDESVLQFFQAPFYNVQYLEHIRSSMLKEGAGIIVYEYDDGFEEALNAIYTVDFTSLDRCTNQQQQTHNSVFPAALDYRTVAQDLCAVQDSHERRVEFGMVYARHLGRAPTGQELEREYTTLGLSKPDSQSDRTSFRFEQISRWLAQSFDTTKCRFGYGGYSVEKDKTEALMAKRVTGIKLDWSKGNGRKPISVAKLAALYWCMRHSQGDSSTTHFSRQQIKSALHEVLNVKCHNAEIAAMLRVLQEAGLIEKVGGYCPGHFGREWTVWESL